MRRVGASLLLAVMFSGAFGLAAAGAQPPPLELVEVSTEGRNIQVTVVAPPELYGAIATDGLFVVDVNGTIVVPAIERIAGDDLDVVLLVDVSGSMTEAALTAAKQAGEAFVRQLPVGTRVALVSFGDTPIVVQPFTADLDAVISQLGQLVAGGETALYSAVVLAAQQFDPTVESIRTVVLLSDGGNTVEEGTLGGAEAALILSDATLHAVSIETTEANPAELDALADRSGGTVARVEQVEAIEALYRSIAINLGNQYRIAFEAPGNGTTPVRIEARSGEFVVAEASFGVALPLLAPPPRATRAPIEPAPTPVPVPIQATAPAARTIDASDNTLLKWGSIIALTFAIGVAAAIAFTPAKRDQVGRRLRPAERFASQAKPGSRTTIGAVVGMLTDRIERLLRGRRLGNWLANMLDTAGWKVRNSEFILLVGLTSAFAFFGGAISSLGVGIALALTVLLGVGLVLTLLVRHRRDAFADQLNGTLQMMAGGLRTGYSLPQVFVMVAEEAAAPTNEEFSRIVVETRLGRDLVDATTAVATRMKNEDLKWTTGAIDITRDVGGDLAGVLDNAASTIRTRARVRRQILALSAEGRVSAWILSGLPVPVFFWQLFVNRTYTNLLFTDPLGRTIFIFAVSALVVGIVWMNRLIKVKY